MSIGYNALENVSRLLLEADLKPLQGDRFQPTGFPDLGPARYTAPDGTEKLLVESPQSVANRMELACWDQGAQEIIEPLKGLPYIKVVSRDGKQVTNSLLEAHRINSEYIIGKKGSSQFKSLFETEIGYRKDGRVDWRKFWDALFKYDPNSLLHGCFLEEIGGRLRVTRAISGFIEATGIQVAESGGVKNNIVQPELKGGEGNVPYPRTEFTAQRITAFFNLDLALLRGYGFPEQAKKLLIALALFKIRRFLSTGLRLRTACDLEVIGDLKITRPQNGFAVPSENDLLTECKQLIEECRQAGLFAKPPVTEVKWEEQKQNRKKTEEEKEEQEDEE